MQRLNPIKTSQRNVADRFQDRAVPLVALILSLMTVSGDPVRGQGLQIMASSAFEQFARSGDALCPFRRLRFTTPSDLDYLEEAFVERLPFQTRKRLAALDQGFKGCANQEAGLSCPAQHKLEAITRLDLLHPFVASACSTRIVIP